MSSEFELLSVFVGGEGGGNAVPVFLDAADLSDERMQELARSTGLESAFLLPARGTGQTGRLRYWVPNHEMSMCGHATVGTAWLLNQLGWPQPKGGYLFDTDAGPISAGADGSSGWFEQSSAGVESVAPERALEALGLSPKDLGGAVQNSAAPRVKTLIPLSSVDLLDQLDPDPASVEAACDSLGWTGLYPYAMSQPDVAHARQFPKSSGYREDPATGIAAAALLFGLIAAGSFRDARLEVLQGWAMGRPSRIVVDLQSGSGETPRCRVSGVVVRSA